MSRPVIALLTDFGLQDHYVGTMKGVILGICRDAAIVDITHDIPPQDVASAALELVASYRYFPEATTFLVVVDPGVGSARRAIAAAAGDHRFVAPDNGVLSLVFDEVAPREVVELTAQRYARPPISRTFEGRDRFAPAAAWLSHGEPLSVLGPAVTGLCHVDMPEPRVAGTMIEGEVVRVDRFGNLITNITAAVLARLTGKADEICISGRGASRTIGGVTGTYADTRAGDLCALVGSSGRLEVAVNGGSAAAVLGASRGARVHVSSRA